VHQGRVILYREIRLAIAPVAQGELGAVFESRPSVFIEFPQDSALAGRHVVHGGYEPIIDRQHLGRWPAIVVAGRRRGISHTRFEDDKRQEIVSLLDDFAAFDPDPVQAPGQVSSEAWYLSYTTAAPSYCRHWLARDHRLGDARVETIWSGDCLASYPAQSPSLGLEHLQSKISELYERNVPPQEELNYPTGFFPATCIERCLHNGLLEEALRVKIDRLRSETKAAEAAWGKARDSHTQALLNRWRRD
jgi:hypothetical protein